MKEEISKMKEQVLNAGKELLKEQELSKVPGQVLNAGKELLKEQELSKVPGQVLNAGKELLKEQELSKVPGQVFNAGKELLKEQSERLRQEAIRLMDDTERKRVWSGMETIRFADAPDTVTPGCLVLEGGSFRGVYTSGVLDVLMENGINLQTVIGTSAGALNGYNYTAGQIGRSAAINLAYRHDHRYFGAQSALKNKGVVGFNFILEEIEKELPFNHERFNTPDRRFLVTVTDCNSGQVKYCEKGSCPDFMHAVQASASMPLVSEPVDVDGVPCLDGGCAVKIPYRWALENGFEKILVVRTRPQYYRRPPTGKRFNELTERIYHGHPELIQLLQEQDIQYNTACDELEQLQSNGRLMMLCPSGSISIGTLEGDMEKLGALYLLGRRDTEYLLPQIRTYLESASF